MNDTNTITEKNYPIQINWVWKSIFSYLLGFFVILILVLFGDTIRGAVYLIFLLISAIIVFLQSIFRRKAFHFSIDEKFLTFQQGVFSKKQRNIPYGVIQNIFVKQDLFDRIFSIASLTIENASQGGNPAQNQMKFLGMKVYNNQKKQIEMVGFDGNKTVIPGLKKQDAETLKGVILKKMKDNPIDDNQSGL